MTTLSSIAEISRAARVGDLDAVNAALDRMDWAATEIMRGRAVADRGDDPPLPPLEVDSIALIAAEAAARGGPYRPRRKRSPA